MIASILYSKSMNKFVENLKFSFLYDLIFPILTSQPIKQKTVKDYAKKYGIKTFIESGTYLGMMVKAVKNSFEKIYTIELDYKLYNHVKNKFKNLRYIKVLHGDSSKILPKILEDIKDPCLFWLDAHYSKGITAKGDKESPIMNEISCILAHKIKDHVILIDDADAFVGKNDYPKISQLRKIILNKLAGMKFYVRDNIIRITPH